MAKYIHFPLSAWLGWHEKVFGIDKCGTVVLTEAADVTGTGVISIEDHRDAQGLVSARGKKEHLNYLELQLNHMTWELCQVACVLSITAIYVLVGMTAFLDLQLGT